ncbi:MAG: hydantoinase/oxoprolinase family protein [Candidatus Geothermarchaeales archaeon]
MARYRLGIDVGGTFTDLLVLDEESGLLRKVKVSSTPLDPSDAVELCVIRFLDERSVRSEEVASVVHATTVAANAILGQKGLKLPKACLITTEGFRDVLEIGRQTRPDLYDIFTERPRPLVPRRYRYVVRERTDAFGSVATPLDEERVVELSKKIREGGFATVAISFINSYVNSRHEEVARKIVARENPGVYVSVSSEVSPEYREYERTSTTVVNALLMPIISRYIGRLADRLKRVGIRVSLQLMQSNAGMASSRQVEKRPMTIIESGPTAGVVASASLGKRLGIDNVLSFDMGGTTAKAGVVVGGEPSTAHEYEVGGRVHRGRIVKGSGYPMRFPFVDLAETSAGGGTIAWVDAAGALRVGPVSAGADPGPACYARGGGEPTVTDADLVLGRLNSRYLLGGELPLVSELSVKAVEEEICKKTGLSVREAAHGIVQIVNAEMSRILRIVSTERGYDLREFAMVAFGGAGPMHACALADELGMLETLVPPSPGLFSAFGLLASDVRHSHVKPIIERVSRVDPTRLEKLFRELEQEGRTVLEGEGFDDKEMRLVREMDLRYQGQSYELTVAVGSPLASEALRAAKNRFHSEHSRTYGYSVEEEDTEVVNLRVTAIGLVQEPPAVEEPMGEAEPPLGSRLEQRRVLFDLEEGFVRCPVFRRNSLKRGNVLEGPAIVEQYDATTVIHPSWRGEIDATGNLRLQRWHG